VAESLTGTLIRHKHSGGSWAVGVVRVKESSDPFLRPGSDVEVRGGRLAMVQVGEGIKITIKEVDHPKYGSQLEIVEQVSLGVDSHDQASRWLQRLDGVGPKTAERIGARFGGGLLELLQVEELPNPDPLLEVVGVGSKLARTIRETWNNIGASGSAEDLRYLDGLGLSRWEVNNVIDWAKRKRGEVRELLESNPWGLCEVKGFGFVKTDKIALLAGASRQAPARCDAALQHQLLASTNEDTWVRLARLVRETAALISVDSLRIVDSIRRLEASKKIVILNEIEGEGRGRWVLDPDIWRHEMTIFEQIRGL